MIPWKQHLCLLPTRSAICKRVLMSKHEARFCTARRPLPLLIRGKPDAEAYMLKYCLYLTYYSFGYLLKDCPIIRPSTLLMKKARYIAMMFIGMNRGSTCRKMSCRKFRFKALGMKDLEWGGMVVAWLWAVGASWRIGCSCFEGRGSLQYNPP